MHHSLICCIAPSGCAGSPAGEPVVAELPAMDTLMKLTLYGENAQAAAEPAKERIRELEGLLSTTDENSEIYAANHSGGAPVALSGDTAALLDRALQLCRRTDGALDVSLSGSTLTLPEGMELDLGAVAKGYTGDVLMDLLEEAGVTSAIVELGGNVHALGSKPDGSPWRVAVQAPEGGYAAALEIVDKAVVTSGGYQRFFEQDGEIYWHIIDPAAGRPARSGLASVTIVAEEGTLCDGLSTALFVMGADRAAEFWRETGDFDFVLLDEEGGVTITEGLEDSFSLCGEWAGRPLEVLRR